MRFGLRKRMIGTYSPGSTVNAYDDLGWYFGNLCQTFQLPAGRSHYYDDTKNLAGLPNNSVGGFHASKRARYSGNQASLALGVFGNTASWCTATAPDPATLPDPLACGGIKQARTFSGVTYAADDPSDPDVGIKIRAHSGTITEEPPACIDWVQNLDSQPSAAAPAPGGMSCLRSILGSRHLCPNPTSLTGGPGGSAPWSIAQALTRGDAATPEHGAVPQQSGGSALSGGREVRLVEPLKARMGGRRLDPFAQ